MTTPEWQDSDPMGRRLEAVRREIDAVIDRSMAARARSQVLRQRAQQSRAAGLASSQTMQEWIERP